jgi:S-adenosylmethionine:tRNA ribosyltransferase-isomerase
VDVADFSFDLPADLVAQTPPLERGTSRLLVLDRGLDTIMHATVNEMGTWLRPGDLFVLNNTRVFPARLIGWREPSGGSIEWLLLHRVDPPQPVSGQAPREHSSHTERWEALVHPGQKLKPGAHVVFGASRRQPGGLLGEILERKFYGRRVVKLWTEDESDVMDMIEQIGHVPLPPYIRRLDEPSDRERYQTVYARQARSVAAPTAGLHFTDALLNGLRAEGVEIVELTLDVGYGTFKPVRSQRVEDHEVDPEPYIIGPPAAAAVNRALDERRRIVAVGTTTTRALESAAQRGGGRVEPEAGIADVFIYPGFKFRIVNALLTNFHLPKSSLLMLVSAFAGRERVLGAYCHAIATRYRFYSYGDAMLIV